MDNAKLHELKSARAAAVADGDVNGVRDLDDEIAALRSVGYETAVDATQVEVTDGPAEVTTEDASLYDDFSKDDLVAECERRGLSKSGNKDELVARLEDDDQV